MKKNILTCERLTLNGLGRPYQVMGLRHPQDGRVFPDSSKQSCLLYGRPIFGEARPTSRLRYGQIASRACIQFLHTKSPIAQQTQEILLKPTNLDGLGLTSDTAVMKRRAN
ncbi:hypothetical protein AVEN_141921-1 [Araneus ventricosus]|uniref:Uncharacterized protein n=1 Tax=Araneus ventricosus TaxID=182803 RepID=A0A4Y2VV13_ARAVE|nr:hypothetical protein AVEN_73507-1 [Araneus ventricosus]GBO28979.1 hypothetical protein AVEN_141921-1 [Araneus ventricosus]